MNFIEHLAAQIQQKKSQGLYRQREILSSPQGTQVVIDNQSYLSFCSNDYLGLANDPDLILALKNNTDHYGVGGGAAHLITGHSCTHHELEEALAAFTGRSKALLFSTGYMANLGLLTALCHKGDLVLEDRLNHASLIDGGLFSAANFKRYQHGDINHLNNSLAQASETNRFIVTDGVFSMDGDIAPMDKIMASARQHNATVIVDDAHGLGVLGANGGGVCEMFSLKEDDQPIIMGTLGKAFGVFGAFVAGSETLIDYLVQTSRTYIYTTAMPSCLAAASLKSLQKIQTENWRREHLTSLIDYFRNGCKQLGLNIMDSQTPIQPIILGDAETAVAWSNGLKKQGILVKAIRPPTVPKGTARLRVTLSAAHSKQDIQHLLDALEQWQ